MTNPKPPSTPTSTPSTPSTPITPSGRPAPLTPNPPVRTPPSTPSTPTVPPQPAAISTTTGAEPAAPLPPEAQPDIVLYYIGDGMHMVPGLPMRDITQHDIDTSPYKGDPDQILKFAPAVFATGTNPKPATTTANARPAITLAPKPVIKEA